MKRRQASQGRRKAMMYTQVVQRRWNKPESPVNQQAPSSSNPSELEANSEKSLKFVQEKTTEYIRNARSVHFQERRMFF
jgi:hypothetical protein